MKVHPFSYNKVRNMPLSVKGTMFLMFAHAFFTSSASKQQEYMLEKIDFGCFS